MNRFLLLLVSLFTAVSVRAGFVSQPQSYEWFGDSNWSLYGPSWYNNQPQGPIGVPYALRVDVSVSGTVKYQFTAGIGGGYRGDQIIWYAKRITPYFLARTQAGRRMADDSMYYELVEARFDTSEAAYAWYSSLADQGYDSIMPLQIETVLYDQIAVTGSPHGVPSPSEDSNDSAQRGWLHTGEFSYDPVLYGNQELRVSFWTFQRQAGNSQKLQMQDRGPWTLPPFAGPPVVFSFDLRPSPGNPTVSLSPALQTINLGQSATLVLGATNASPTDNQLDGDGAPASVPLSGDVTVIPGTAGTKTYSYSVVGTSTLIWKVAGTYDSLTLTGPSGSIDVTARPLSRPVSVSGNYTLTAKNSAGSSTSDPVHVDVATASATAVVIVNAGPGPGGTVVSLTPIAHDVTVANGAAAGHTYHRIWQDGSTWKAYLGRSEVTLQVAGSSTTDGVAQFELQAQKPNGDWSDIAPMAEVDASVPNGAGVVVAQTFSVQFGDVRSDKPLIPSDTSVVGIWQLRGRVQTTAGVWSDWSEIQPINVVLPIKNVAVSAQTLPPAGPDATWFAASSVQNYNYQVWIP